MSQVIVESLIKTYKVAKREPGLMNAVRGLVHREYNTVHALEGVSFKLDEGELVGYIGPNGAGKSTTVKILSGILVPDSGRCEVMGKVPWKHRVSHVSKIGVVFGQRSQLWWDLPVLDSFELLKDIYKVPATEYKKTKNELIEWLKLSDILEIPVRQLSLGQRMKCELAASLLHSPPLLFLDEPTIGLDAVSKLAVREFIKKLNKERGVTVILTTHDMDDIEALCSRVMMIGKGKKLFDGSIEDLRNHVSRKRRLIIDIENNLENLNLNHAETIKVEGNKIHIDFDPQLITPAELISQISLHNKVTDLLIENPPIEEVIAKMYGDLKL